MEVVDTLAWIQHLLGRDVDAARLMDSAVKASPPRAVIRLHAAVVFAAVGRLDDARKELGEALRLDPSLDTGDEVKALRARLK